ncbi:MAG: MarR family EPS-associated transcriptional regulator [Gemmatimonadetes bacterium]|nr:MarR family EPS-associated transcriptional regulator [Gemmatimonadota bacterium]
MPVDNTQLELIRLLEADPVLTQRQLSKLLGVSLGKANYCLRELISRGLVKAKNYRTSQNKAAYLYILTPSGIAAKGDMARRFLVRKMHEYDALTAELEVLRREAGE